MPEQSAPEELRAIAPRLVEVTNDVLFGDVWKRPGLSPRDRSLVTVATLAALYRDEQLGHHLGVALDRRAARSLLSVRPHPPSHTRTRQGRTA